MYLCLFCFIGVCYRFFSEADFKALEKFSTPEIQRVPLDSIVLQMVSMGLPDVRKFPFIEPPPIESLEESVLVLKAQDALNPDEVCGFDKRFINISFAWLPPK